MVEVQEVGPEAIDGRFGEVIDVRSPSEFAEDRVPGAVNLPVLDDAERAEVGTIYRAEGAFVARRRGAALISARIAGHLRGHFAGLPPGYRPLVYCWRGGQRSLSLATILAAVGWPVAQLAGGYKAYRRWVREESARLLAPGRAPSFVVVAGLTGSGKTRLLRRMAERGIRALDLEGLANHRGSLLGGEFPDPAQPSQKQFENRLFHALRDTPPGGRVFVESESNKIGDLHIPGPLWTLMRAAPMVELAAGTPERARFLLAEYRHLRDDPALLAGKLDGLRRLAGHAAVDRWKSLAASGDWEGFVADLLTNHYDAAYLRSRRRIFGAAARHVPVDPNDPSSVDLAIDALTAPG
jgi:tRNA 2-selenouridine synthase